ncbi:C-X-C chemokine receptor type 5 [Pungitius pungitius]|uniref:C-X-C chemokine receptor type 5 n=1 Tax=Pungitius pungitius TaxID=134920 RepID=UPI002E13911B
MTDFLLYILQIGTAGNITDYNYGNDTAPSVCDDEGNSLWIYHAVLYSLIFLVGVSGNGLMTTVLLRRRHLLRITEIYLLHLALADLMLLFTFPFDVVNHAAGWLFGEFLCKLTGLVQNLNLHCGSFLLACIGFDRYLAVVFAIPSMQSRRPKTVHLTCIALWLVCLGLSVPNAVFLSVREEARQVSRLHCFYHDYGIHANNWVLTNRVLEHMCFFIPLAVMSYCYTAVVITLCNSKNSLAKQGAIRLSLLVTLVFFFCWLPYNVTLLIKTMVDLDVISYETCELYVTLQSALDVTKSLGLAHCFLNPFLYAFVGVRFRHELIHLLCNVCCRNVCAPFFQAQGPSRSSVSDRATTTSTITKRL